MDGEPLMDSEGIGEVRAALAAFPGLAGVAVIEHGGRSIEAMVLAGRISTALGIRISMAGLFKASTVGDVDRRLDVMADARK
jgi:hypothetical protein